ncbi:hypothetical protein EZV62_017253 [Acer yangbiense]|uniref:Rx N-terminal domain-containing protein n=1 Tax=Acer yangbiense TaxID=1000413 RepID=A0A5C7HFW8_9ROSI|nr:hypothetical protein EZV62_017253 [Acer yangbiense]
MMYFILILVLVRHDLLQRLFNFFFFGHTSLGLRIEQYRKIYVVVTTFFFSSFPSISTEVYSLMSTDRIAHFRVQYRMISSEEFSDFFQRQKLDEALLTKLKENMKTIAKKVHVDSFYQVITESGDWEPTAWLNVLHRIILDLDDLLHDVAKLEEKFKIITTLWSYCCNSTCRIFLIKYRPSTSPEKDIEDRMKEIIKEMEDLAVREINNSYRNWVEAAFGISDKKLKEKLDQADKEALLKEKWGRTNGTDLIEMPVETGVGSTRPPETSKISNEDSSIKHEGASEIPLKMTESSSDTDDPIICLANSVYRFEAIRQSKMMYFILILFLVFVLVRHDLLHRLFNFFFFCHTLLGLRIEQYKEIYVVVTTFVCSSFPFISTEVYSIMSTYSIAHFRVQYRMISSEEFSEFFQRQKLDEALLTKLKENMKTIDDMVPVVSISKVIIEPGDWEPSLSVLHGIILDLDDLLHDVAKSGAKFKIITTLWSYCWNSTFRIFLKKYRPSTSLEKGIEDRMKEIIEEMERLAQEIYDGSNYFEAVFGILDKKLEEKWGRTNGTDLIEMPVETGVGSTRPPETSKISNEDSSIKHEGASEIPLKMTESSSDTDDPINIWYSQMSSLESLKVSEISQLLKLPPRLHTLKIEGCDALESLPEELMLNNIHLQQLYIIDCCFLESFSVDHLPTTLKSLYIRNCRKLKFPSPSETMQHALLEHLCIGSSCDSLSSFHLSLFPELRSLAIWDCVNFSSISISENHKSLDALEIRDCPELLSFLEEGLHTPNLTSIFLSNCKNLKVIPKPMDKLISLRSFFINGCPELSSIIHGCFPENLSSLCITYCHKLTPSIQWKMNELNKLSCFEIEGGCMDLKSFPEQNLLPSSLNSLRISRLSNLEFLDYKGLECLTSLETLKINGCDKLQSFPEEGLPSSVTYLYINECSLLKARFQNKRGKEWGKIAHVTHIEIDEEVLS